MVLSKNLLIHRLPATKGGRIRSFRWDRRINRIKLRIEVLMLNIKLRRNLKPRQITADVTMDEYNRVVQESLRTTRRT